jgi:hypothetical protein
MIRLLLLFLFAQGWATERTLSELISLTGRKGETTRFYDLYQRTPCAGVSEYASFSAALTAAPSCLSIADTVTLATNVSVPAGMALQVMPGGYFTGAHTLTVNGTFIAGMYKVFDATVTVTLAPNAAENALPEWWGAKGDDATDCTTAIQRALNASRAAAMGLDFAAGTYRISSPITITGDGNAIRLTGRGLFSSLKATSSMAGMLTFPSVDSQTNWTSGSRINGLSFNGNSLAEYGIYGLTNHGTFENFKVTGTTTAALDISYGWCNTFNNLEIVSNTGDGLRLNRRGASNSATVTTCKIFANSGFGAILQGSTAVAFYNCTFETNRKGGVFFQGNVKGFTFNTTYCEGNGATGWIHRYPSVDTVRADFILNGTADDTTVSAANENTGSIVNSQVTAGSAKYHVWSASGNGITIENCRRVTDSITLFRIYGSPSTTSPEFSYSNPGGFRVATNVGWGDTTNRTLSISPLGYDVLKVSPQDAFISEASNRNIAVKDLSTWTVITAAGGGTFTSSAQVFPYDAQASVYALTLGTTSASDAYGFTLNAANYTAFQGRYFVFAVWASHSNTLNMSGAIKLNPQGTVRQVAMDYGVAVGWQLISGVFKFPTSGTVSLGVQKIVQSGGASGTMYVTNPILCELGSNFNTLQGIR